MTRYKKFRQIEEQIGNREHFAHPSYTQSQYSMPQHPPQFQMPQQPPQFQMPQQPPQFQMPQQPSLQSPQFQLPPPAFPKFPMPVETSSQYAYPMSGPSQYSMVQQSHPHMHSSMNDKLTYRMADPTSNIQSDITLPYDTVSRVCSFIDTHVEQCPRCWHKYQRMYYFFMGVVVVLIIVILYLFTKLIDRLMSR